MGAIDYRSLRRQVELDGIRQTCKHLSEALQNKELSPDDFSLKKSFEALVVDGSGAVCGREALAEFMVPGAPSMDTNLALAEASGAVMTGHFANITGQVFYNKILEGYNAEAFTFTKMIPSLSTNLSGERIPGIGDIGDQAQIVAEAAPYPLAGVGEDFIDTPQTTKRGLIVPVTKEAVFFDRTGILLRRCSQVGEALGINKEKRAVNCVIDQNATGHRYKWRGTTLATYQTSTPWINKTTSNGLLDWTNIDAAEQKLAAMTDPNTGEPIAVMADTIIVAPQKFAAALMALNAMGATIHTGGYPVTGNPIASVTINPTGKGPYSGTYTIVSSRYVPAQLATDTDWFLGAPTKAFAYMENWPITVTQAPVNSETEFTNDIVYRYKASERGAYATLEPRLMHWSVQ